MYMRINYMNEPVKSNICNWTRWTKPIKT